MRDYFRLIQKENVAIRKKGIDIQAEAVICKVEGTEPLQGIDFLESENIISERLKLRWEAFLPRRTWKPYVFVDMEKKKQEIFWNLELKKYVPEQAFWNGDGTLSRVVFQEKKIPRICNVAAKKGERVILLDLSVLESMLRREIRGVKWEPVLVYPAGVEEISS